MEQRQLQDDSQLKEGLLLELQLEMMREMLVGNKPVSKMSVNATNSEKCAFDVRAALNLAKKAHERQFRKDVVTPYIKHPIAVVKMLKSWRIMNPEFKNALFSGNL